MSDSIEIEDIIKPFWFKDVSDDIIEKCYNFLDNYYFMNLPLDKLSKAFTNYQREEKIGSQILKFGYLLIFYKMARISGKYPNPNKALEKVLKIKNVRENSGVMVFSIFTSGYPSYTRINPDGTTEIVKEFSDNPENPGAFSCKYDCAYCPAFPNMPRSYMEGEPSVSRAIQANFEVFKMITSRAIQYLQQGHPLDKAEVIIQGGTWDSYSYEYRTEFIRDVYYTFNVLMDYIFGKPLREKLSMEEEIKLNETASVRVVGLTPETRPDQINYKSIQFLRKIGATRVQLGVQHLDDNILRYIERRCYTKDTIRAIKMLKDNGFKVDCHLMLDLPAESDYADKMPEIDRKMLEEFNTNPNFKIDQLKLYPCVVTPYTKIKTWYEEGKYKPYGELKKMTPEEKIAYRRLSKEEKLKLRMNNPLYKNIFDFYQIIHPSIRINRVFRDIPTDIICGGTTQTSMRSEMDMDLETIGLLSNCIKYREAGNTRNKNRTDIGELIMKELTFESSGGTEYFLTWESSDDNPVLYSFLRLRLSKNSGKTDKGKIIFPELVDCALIREVHTYGKVMPCKENQKYYKDNNILFSQEEDDKPQHKGLGKKLIKRAEEIAIQNGYKKMGVIAGVGVREYYRKLGYTEDSDFGCYQIKKLDINKIKLAEYVKDNTKRNLGIFLRLFYLLSIALIIIIVKYFF
jgi:histone acetyltransferase (RNA polymerase elongator complex component)